MTGYADTGLICSLYAPDAHSKLAVAKLAPLTASLPWTWLHQVEFRNAMRLRVFRTEITEAQRDASFQAWLSDLAAGIWVRVDPDQESLLTVTERLSLEHAQNIGARSLDILHVAAAQVLGCRDMLTFDHRQQDLAEAAGLRLL